MKTIVILLSVFAVGTFAYCPLWDCDKDIYGTKDYDECLTKVDAAVICVKNALAQDDICEECDKYTYNYYAGAGYVKGRQAHCLREQCQQNELFQCSRKALGIYMFHDTSEIDEIISCLQQWNPAPGKSKCLNTILRIEIPDFADPIAIITQILTEIKAGCDPVIPVVECRKELAGLSPFMMAGPGMKPPGRDVIQGAIDGMANCVSTAIKKYPCKTLETMLPVLKDVISKSVTDTLMRRPGGSGGPGGPENLYDLNCPKNDEARFAKFFNFKK